MALSRLVRSAAAFLTTGAGFAAHAAEPEPPPAVQIDVSYDLEVLGPVSGAETSRGVLLDNLLVEAAVDLERSIGWQGAAVYGSLLSNSGGRPNDFAGTLEGVSNIEVDRQRAKLFELWLEQDLGGYGSVMAGLLDVNRDFYVTESAGLLLSPPFGIGSEIASTGPNGPSIFPSTALGLRYRTGEDGSWYAQAAFVGASAGTLGDPDEDVVDFRRGGLMLAEAGVSAPFRMTAGLWRYTDRQHDIRTLNALGEPAHAISQGAYLTFEHRLVEGGGQLTVDVFGRAGLSGGHTTDFGGGVQAGALVSGFLQQRPDAQASMGLRYGALNAKARDNLGDLGIDPSHGEIGLELTYADPVTSWLTLQPDLQLIFDAGGAREAETVVVAGLRATLSLGWRSD